MRAIPSILAVAVTAAGLAGATYGAFDHEWKAVLAPVSGSNITGTAEVEGKDKDKKAEAEISIKGATPGAQHPWHVHSGEVRQQWRDRGSGDRLSNAQGGQGRLSQGGGEARHRGTDDRRLLRERPQVGGGRKDDRVVWQPYAGGRKEGEHVFRVLKADLGKHAD